MGIGFIWPVIMGVGILTLRESPRWEFRKGKVESARKTIALSYGVPEDHPEVQREIREIQEKLEAERAGGGQHPWYEIFTGPKMLYRTLLGIALQALQQLTGSNVGVAYESRFCLHAYFPLVLLLLRHVDLHIGRVAELLRHLNDSRRRQFWHYIPWPLYC